MLSFEKLMKDNNGELIIGSDNDNDLRHMLPKYIIN